jgi:hypothetical protein
MKYELTLEQQEREMQSRRDWAQFIAKRDSETRLEFVARVAAMMLRGAQDEMWAGDEFFTAYDVANELEALVFELTNQQKEVTQ